MCFASHCLVIHCLQTYGDFVKEEIEAKDKEKLSGLKVSADYILLFNTYKEYAGIGLGERGKAGRRNTKFNGYDLEHAVRLLISIGMDALDYLVTRPEMIKYGDGYHFNYDNQNAIHRYAIYHFCYMSIRLMVILCR